MIGLLIEDDPNKASKILKYIEENHSSYSLIHRLSYQSGLKEIFKKDFDFILLDMSLPSYDQGQGSFSGKPRNFGGRDILKEMKRYKRKSKVVIITQYNEFDGGLISINDLDKQLNEKYSELYNGYIYYNSRQSSWMNKLSNFLKSL